MLKNLSLTTKVFGGLILAVIVFFLILMMTSSSHQTLKKQQHFSQDSAASDNKVEALKTMTANLVAVESQNEQLQNELNHLKTQNQQTLQALNQQIDHKISAATAALKNQSLTQQKQWQRQLSQVKYPIHHDVEGQEKKPQWNWISDLSAHYEQRIDKKPLIISQSSIRRQGKIKTADPVYTIPVNATLTGASLMTPLIGRIPIDGNLPDPYAFKAVLSASNLTANGYPLPGVKGAVISGVARGDMLARCARADVKSITFIFNDGRISTTKVDADHQKLGYLSQEDGNPCIPGQYKSNEGVVLGMTMGLNFAKGYAEGIANSQYMRSITPQGSAISSLIGSSSKVGIGQGLSSAATSAENWWDRRIRNSFDFVFVPNWIKNTKQILKVDVNITQQIAIDYDKQARKVSYETKNNTNSDLLD